jgi:ubiquinone/menaquinone biosynthesis C-methylase UbiE
MRFSFGWQWNELGRRDAFAAILTPRDGETTPWSVDEFFATGRADIARFIERLGQVAPRAGRRTALDFGCGVGRITRALSDHFESVIGIDVAPSMIARARELNSSSPRCRFAVNRAPHLRAFATDSFDLAYSRLVLQHIVPRQVRRYVPELLRVLAPGGVLMFQLPTVIDIDPLEAFCAAPVADTFLKRHLPRALIEPYRTVKYRYITRNDRREPAARMEMFGMAQEDVLDLLRRSRGRVLDVRPDDSHGTDAAGFEYWVTK